MKNQLTHVKSGDLVGFYRHWVLSEIISNVCIYVVHMYIYVCLSYREGSDLALCFGHVRSVLEVRHRGHMIPGIKLCASQLLGMSSTTFFVMMYHHKEFF